MPLKPNRSIIIVGAGPLMSRSLSLYLASQNWQIILLSRNKESLTGYAQEINEKYPSAPKVLFHQADGSDPDSLTTALNWAASQLPDGKVDVLCYNAARVAANPILSLTPETLLHDFGISAVGTLIAGQWFSTHANNAHVREGEYPMLIVVGGLLDKYPDPDLSSLSTVKSASQCLAKMFSMVFKNANILVAAPLISGAVLPNGGGLHDARKMEADNIIQGVFKRFFEDRERVDSVEDWAVERVW